MASEDCLREDTLLGFVHGKLAADTRARVEAHLAACPACTEVATWTAAEVADAAREPGREGLPFLGQLAPGSRIGRYQILAPIGRGGMGEVYAAYHPDLDRRIALKVVYESAAHGAEQSARLLREARAIARLSHPNVVAVYDAGTVDERVYIAMEFVDGDTLDEWLRAKPRSWREIVDVFIAAGRGLAAAHAAEIVHRDFKPQNVMIGKDGSVRVMDFGLARLVGDVVATARPADALNERVDGSVDAETQSRAAAAAMTKTGALLGTPAYMAPEQFRGEPADARADQFSFCVTLHEALCGERPILAHRLAGATDSTTSASTTTDSSIRATDQSDGTPPADDRAALARASIPSWLRHVVRRGLVGDPSARFPSLAALLTALQRGRNRVRRRALTAAATGALALIALTGWRAAHPLRFDCRPPADRIAAAWPIRDPTHPRRQVIEKVFLASGQPEAETVWRRFASTLDDYLDRWTRMYSEACEATHHRGEQSPEVLDLRMRCLNENLDDVRALTSVVASGPNAASTSQALAAASQLVPVSRCADVRVLRSILPLPRDEVSLRKVEALAQSVRELQALFDTGRWSEALAKGRAIRPAVEATGYRPLLAELLARIGSVELVLGDPAQSESTLFEALVVGAASGNPRAGAMAASGLVFAVGYMLGRHAEGRRWARLGEGLLEHVDSGRSEVQAWILSGEAAIDFQEHHFPEAQSKAQRSYELRAIALGEDHPQLAGALSDLGLTAVEMGAGERALAFIDRSLALSSRYGEPSGSELNNRGEALRLLGRDSEARREFERSIASAQNDFYLAYPLTALGILDCDTGQAAAAVPLLEKALRIRESKEPDPFLVAETRFALARALWDSRGSHRRALSLARAARTECHDDRCPRRLSGLESWLSLHDRHGGNRTKVALH